LPNLNPLKSISNAYIPNAMWLRDNYRNHIINRQTMTTLEILLIISLTLLFILFNIYGWLNKKQQLLYNEEIESYKRELAPPKDFIYVRREWAEELLAKAVNAENELYKAQFYLPNGSQLNGYAKSIKYILEKQSSK